MASSGRGIHVHSHMSDEHTVCADNIQSDMITGMECTNMPESPPTNQKRFKVDTTVIPQVSVEDQAAELHGLGLDVYNQDVFEQGLMAQIDDAMALDEQVRLERLLQSQLKDIKDDIRRTSNEMAHLDTVLQSLSSMSHISSTHMTRRIETMQQQKDSKKSHIQVLNAKMRALTGKMKRPLLADSEHVQQSADRNAAEGDIVNLEVVLGLAGRSPEELEHERLVQTGEITPFGSSVDTLKHNLGTDKLTEPEAGPSKMSDFERFLLDRDNSSHGTNYSSVDSNHAICDTEHRKTHTYVIHGESSEKSQRNDKPPSENIPRENLFDAKDKFISVYNREKDYSTVRGKRKWYPKIQHNFSEDGPLSGESCDNDDDDDDRHISSDENLYNRDNDEWLPEIEEDQEEAGTGKITPSKQRPRAKVHRLPKEFKSALSSDSDDGSDGEVTTGKPKKRKSSRNRTPVVREKDDNNARSYEKRIKAYQKSRLLDKQQRIINKEPDESDDDLEFDGGFKVPADIWTKLYRYQKTGVKWLWELHSQQAGGIIGDEMGLGKTIQMIAFFTGLKYSKLRSQTSRYIGLGPCLIVCPATLMHQWLREFHVWSPLFRVTILHNSGSYVKGTESSLVANAITSNSILITSYSSLVIHQELVLHQHWHYVVLDEGHKIRNPEAKVTVCCKQLKTPHRLILSGSPVQNNLKELWSLFDFVFPGKLGTLPDFLQHFSVPIVQGGYSNATQVQVQTAYRCACVLRDTINPYLLRRMKADVRSCLNLPNKNEQVLFCRLTDEQRQVYQEYLGSRQCQAILAGRFKVFVGLITLRKICNHPDICTGGPKLFVGEDINEDVALRYGYRMRSGKMIVVESLLKIWKKQGHRVLLFSQSKAMLDILETFVQGEGYSYLRLDGGTSIPSRQPLINKFNSEANIFIFLLTTRVGGLGVNLTGANRVVIFDPDWNPSTDTQARERAWRIGQQRHVTIYRLLTTGTIEEKIYHRQIFKQFLTNRVLKDPKQQRFFKTNDLYELFTLGAESSKDGTETSAIFAGIGSEVRVMIPKKHNRFDDMEDRDEKKTAQQAAIKEKSENDIKLSKMHELARKLSRQIGRKQLKTSSTTVTNTHRIDESKNSLTTAHAMPDSGIEIDDQVSRSVSNKHKSLSESGVNGKLKSHSKSKKRKHRKDAKFEGKTISHLVKHGSYHSAKEQEDMQLETTAQDDYVLTKLFSKAGIQSALQHEVIMNSSKADYALVEGEAEKVARAAAAELKKSQARCRQAWAGRREESGAPSMPRFGQKKNSALHKKPLIKQLIPATTNKKSKPMDEDKPKLFDGHIAGGQSSTEVASSVSTFGLMNSTQLLLQMRSRNTEVSAGLEEEQEDGSSETPSLAVTRTDIIDLDGLELITDIRNFIAFQASLDCRVTTQELLDEFGPKLPPGESAKFKAMLHQICSFEKSNDIGLWRLKSQFR